VRMAPVHLAAGPPTYTGAVNTLKRRAADAGVKASISTGCATPLLCAGWERGTETGLRAHAGWTSNGCLVGAQHPSVNYIVQGVTP
jgi:hypothetical protein